MQKRKVWKQRVALLLLGAMVFGATGCAETVEEEQEKEKIEQNLSGDLSLDEDRNPVIKDENENNEGALAIYTAEYPKMNPYPGTDGFDYDEAEYTAWRESINAMQAKSDAYQEGVWEFAEDTISNFLADTNGENKIYSPLNIYLALGMLAEVTENESRGQILDLLHVPEMETLRQNAMDLWKAHYCDDGRLTSKLGASIWLNRGVNYVPETLMTLAGTYKASSYQGEMGSAELNQALRNWLNEQTGGLLEEQAENVELSQETVFALASTIYFQAKWEDTFSEKMTKEEVFHGPDGDTTCDFMHSSGTGTYYWSDNFAAVSKAFEPGGTMFFFLPDEDVSVEELLEDENVLALLKGHFSWEDKKFLVINQSIPKFDVASDLSLVEELQELGVTDVFNGSVSDFSPLTKDMEGNYLSEVKHAARVKIDEEGCEAAAYTVMVACGESMPPDEEVDFVLDRPFLFVITGRDGLPLFIGVVNQP